MGKLSYVVVSTPRSATGWASQALTAMGLQCGHEAHYSLHKKCDCVGTLEGVWGDSSWLAVPFIKDLPPGTVVLHQVRNPWDTIASIVGLGWFEPWKNLKASDEKYLDFVVNHALGDVMRGYTGSPVHHAAHFWMTWHMMIELYTKARSDLVYVRYQVDRYEVGEPEAAERMYRAITGRAPDFELLHRTRSISRKHNTRGYAKPDVWPRKLDPHVVELANRYGYPDWR